MRKRSNNSKTLSIDGFTLAEMLVVIALIGLLFALILPALDSITNASKLDDAANAVHSASKLARQYALSHDQPTYLVFHNDRAAYAVFSINIHTNPVTQAEGYFLMPWEPLPAGIVFDDSAGGTTNIYIPTTASWDGAISKNNLLKIQGTTYIVQAFDPMGKSGSASHWIHIAEGFYTSDGLQRTAPRGKQIQFSLSGKSRIIDIRYTDNGQVEELNVP